MPRLYAGKRSEMVTLYLARHGETESNRDNMTIGQLDSPLTKKGESQARTLGRFFKKYNLDRIYSSDLERAMKTAAEIGEITGGQVVSSKALREINYGKAGGLPKEVAKKQFPKYKKDAAYVFPEGESYNQVKKRVVKFLQEIEKKSKGEDILLVTHSGPLRAMYCHYTKESFQENLRKKFPHTQVGKMEIENGRLKKYEILRE